MAIITEPHIDERPEQVTMGIRVQVPMRSLSKSITALHKELNAYQKQHGVVAAGPPFVRYYVIDMAGEMDIEAGIPVAAPLPEQGRVRASSIPAGRYASLVYTGSGLTGNKTLLDWGKSQGIVWDRWNDAKGVAFRARYESYLTDPKSEPRKTKWHIEVAIKLAEVQPAA